MIPSSRAVLASSQVDELPMESPEAATKLK